MKLAPMSAGMADKLSATLPRRVSQVTTTAWKNSDSRFTAEFHVARRWRRDPQARRTCAATYFPCSLYMNAPMVCPAMITPAMPSR